MTPDELYAKGYAIEWSPWGAYVYLDTPDHMDTLEQFTVHSDHMMSEVESQALGWRAAEIHYVARRLDGNTNEPEVARNHTGGLQDIRD